MTAVITICCDHTEPSGPCARRITLPTPDPTHAATLATSWGWQATSTSHLCPTHR